MILLIFRERKVRTTRNSYKILQLVVQILSSLPLMQSQSQNVTQQCEVNYKDHGPERTLQNSDFHNVYDDPLGTTLTFEECRTKCDNDPQCKSFVFDNNTGGIHCGLSETNNMLVSENCSTCFVYTKNCSSDCITYTMFSGGNIGRNQYANYDPSTYNVCKNRCSNDQSCNGFIHNAATLACRLVDSSYPILSIEDANYSFSRKECEFGCATYLAIGKEYLLHTSSLFYLKKPITISECALKCNSNPYCRGYDFVESGKSCGLSYSGRKHKQNGCFSCSAFSKQCPLGNYSIPTRTCTGSSYETHHPDYIPSAIYWTIPFSSYNACQLYCDSEDICHGFAYDGFTRTCTLSESTLPRFTYCPHCSFSAKKCSELVTAYFMQCSSTFTLLGHQMKVPMFKVYATYSTTDLTACQQQCANDSGCMSFHFQSDISQCQISKTIIFQSYPCTLCTFYRRECLPGCGSVMFMQYDLGYRVSSIKDQIINDIPLEECKLLCENDTYCFGFSFKLDTLDCTLSDAGDPVWYPSDESISFFKKTCTTESAKDLTTVGQFTTKDLTTVGQFTTKDLTTVGQFTTKDLTTVGQFTTKDLTTVGHLTAKDMTTLGQFTTKDLTTVGQFTTKDYTTYSQTIQSTEQQTEETTDLTEIPTVIQEQTGTSQSQQTTKQDINQTMSGQIIITNGSIACTCICKEINQSLEESLKQRKDELTLNSKTLSSKIRKLTSASDFRTSSSSIAGVVVGVLGCFIAMIIVPDLYSVVSFILKKIYSKQNNNTE